MESEDTRSSIAPVLSEEIFYNYITKSIVTTQINIKGYILVAIMDGTYEDTPSINDLKRNYFNSTNTFTQIQYRFTPKNTP
jgi:hypothetical protein